MFDVIWNICDLANKLEIDLEKAFEEKMMINKNVNGKGKLKAYKILCAFINGMKKYVRKDGTNTEGELSIIGNNYFV